MPTDTTIIDRLRDADKLVAQGEVGMALPIASLRMVLQDAWGALTAAHAALAECYRLTGADPDGNEDWRLATNAVAEVKRLREESDAEIAAAHAARDAAERELALASQALMLHTRQYLEATDTLRAQLTTARRERDEARAAIPRGTGVSP